MQTIHVNTSKPYTVYIGSGILESAGKRISAVTKTKRVMVVSDDIVFPLYGEILISSLAKEGFTCDTFVYPNGEEHKRLSTVEALLEQMAKAHFTRSDIVIALGGGVCGDMAGFAASVYARGIDYVQIPTTLLAAVDSSVGGKTAVDLAGGKNLCGAFHQPILVLCDTDTLQTLKEIHIEDGLAEMLKYGVICDRDLFDKVKAYKQNDLAALIARCVEIKRDIVSADEFDKGQRMLLNLGHTVGHAVEAASNFKITHGHGVAIGLAIISRAAHARAMLAKDELCEILSTLEYCGLPTSTDIDADTLFTLTLSDKKSDGNCIHLVMPKRIGACMICRTEKDDVRDVIKAGL